MARLGLSGGSTGMGTFVSVSVIIPVYNVAPWIGRCIESLKAQCLDGLEFIFVDDCSTDGSLALVEAFAKEDPRARILRNEEHLGTGPSRNRGIEAARGDWLSFVDPDDWLGADFYALLHAEVQRSGCDIVKGARLSFTADGEPLPQLRNRSDRRIAKRLAQGAPLFAVFTFQHQSAVYRASLFKDGDVRYGSSFVAEDTTFLLRVCAKAADMAFCDDAVYCYRRLRPGSATSNTTLRRAFWLLDALEEQTAFIVRQEPHAWYGQLLMSRAMACLAAFHYAELAESAPEDRRADFRARFLEQVERIRDAVPSCPEPPEFGPLKTDGFVIPPRRFQEFDPLACERVERWTAYLATAPADERQWLDACADAFAYSLARCCWGLLSGRVRRDALAEAWPRLRRYWSRLERGHRWRIALRLPKACCELVVGRMTGRL